MRLSGEADGDSRMTCVQWIQICNVVAKRRPQNHDAGGAMADLRAYFWPTNCNGVDGNQATSRGRGQADAHRTMDDGESANGKAARFGGSRTRAPQGASDKSIAGDTQRHAGRNRDRPR